MKDKKIVRIIWQFFLGKELQKRNRSCRILLEQKKKGDKNERKRNS